MSPSPRWRWYCVLPMLLLAAPLGAALAPKLSTEALVRQADVIVHGRCTSLESRWIDRDLVTFAEVSVRETLKGPTTQSLTVVLPGGVDTSGSLALAMDYSGAPTLSVDEENVLFLRAVPGMPGHFTILGYSQGRYRVQRKPGAEPAVFRDLSGLTLQSAEGREPGRVTRDSLTGLRAEIARILAPSSSGSGRNVP